MTNETFETSKICPICGAGHLSDCVDKNAVDYQGHAGVLEVHYSVCDACGSEQADAEQLAINKRAMLALKKRFITGVVGSQTAYQAQ